MNKFFTILFLAMLFPTAYAIAGDYSYILELSNSSVYPTTIYPNTEVSLNLQLENISQLTDAANVTVKLDPNSNYFEIIKGTETLEMIKFQQTGTASLRFKVKENTPGGYYSFPYVIEYIRDGSKYTINSQVSISVENYDKLNLILTSYPNVKNYLDDKIYITGIVKNEGNTTLKGISVSTSFDTATLIPLTEINQFSGDLQPGQSKDYNFSFTIPKTATPGVYDINIIAVDVSNTEDNEKVSFIVEDNPNLIVSSIDKSIELNKTYLTQNTHFSLSVQLENISKSKAKSVVITIIDTSTKVEGTTIAYVGSIDADDSGAGIFDLYVAPDAKIGDQKLTIEISYLDVYDVEHKFTRDVSIFIDKAKKSNGFWGYAIVLVIIAGIGYYFYNNSKKKKNLRKIE